MLYNVYTGGVGIKKILLLAGMLFLTGCAGQDVAKTSDTEEIEQIVVSKTKQQLGEVLEQTAQRLGTMPNNTSYYNNELGLAHAGLIDLNQDGQNELYMLLKGSPYYEDELSHRNQDSYIFEIWAANAKEDEAQLLFNEAINLEDSEASDFSISFIKSNKGQIFIKTNYSQTTQGTNYNQSTYYAYRKDTISRMLESYYSDGEMNEQRLDTTEVDMQTFQTKLQQYEGEEKFVIESRAGKKTFAFDTADLSGHFSSIFTKLTKDFNPFLTDGEDAARKDFEQIEKEMQHYTFHHTMDKRDTSTYTSLINGLIFDGKVEQDSENIDYFIGYTETQIAKKMKQLYDIDLDATSLQLPSPNNPSQTIFLHYEDGVFYISHQQVFIMILRYAT